MTDPARIARSAAALITDGFRAGTETLDLSAHRSPLDLGRPLDVDGFRRCVDEAMRRHPGDPVASDAWLAPRVHTRLRLTRAEAADATFWAWIALEVSPEYVRWRWPGRDGSGTPAKRFVGRDRDHAIARLWWAAELFRDGPAYGPVERAFEVQDIVNTWLGLDALHHRAAAQAALRLLPSLSSKRVNRVSTALAHVLVTVQLDAIAPSPAPDVDAVRNWLTAPVPTGPEDLPSGPDDGRPERADVERVAALIERVAAAIGVPTEVVTSA